MIANETLELNVAIAKQRVIQLNEQFRFRSLFSNAMKDRALYFVKNRNGISTIGLRTEDIEHHHLIGIMGFRLSQYLQLGWADAELMYRNRWFHEPFNAVAKGDVHIISGDAETGRILGYVTTAGVKGNDTHLISELDRPLFPCEVAHGADVFHHMPCAQETKLSQVREIKRFVKNQNISSDELGLLVSLEVLCGLMSMAVVHMPDVRMMVGDLEEHVVLRHMRMLDFEVEVIEGTTPSFSKSEIMHTMYIKRMSVKPFILTVPESESLAARVHMLDQLLESKLSPLSIYKQIYNNRKSNKLQAGL